MSFLIILLALVLLMYIAYSGHSVIFFAPLVALLAVLLTDPSAVPVMFTGVFMEKLVQFLKLYFPVFLLGALFGKAFEISQSSKSVVTSVVKLVGEKNALLSIVLVSSLLTYGGVSLFVVVFAIYPFAVDMFKKADIPKRLIPGTIALGAFTYTMDALPGSPQIQNIIPTTFFKTDTWAAPWLGVIGGIFVFVLGLAYLESRKRSAKKNGEGYGQGHIHEPMETVSGPLPSIWLALTPLVLVVALNKLFTPLILKFYSDTASVQFAGMDHAISLPVSSVASVWSITLALLVAILFIFISSYKLFVQKFTGESKAAIAGALLAAMNTATEYGFGAVIAALPGFLLVKETLQSIPNVLVNAAVTVTTLAGITGSASGGLSIALAAMSDYFVQMAQANQIPLEVLHRISSMASGGMDTLPHNGAVITLLTVTGLTHRQSYKDIFMITCLKTIAVFFVIAVYYGTGIV